MLGAADKFNPVFGALCFATRLHEVMVMQIFGNDVMSQGCEQGRVCSGTQCQVMGGLDMWRLYQFNGARINNNKLCPLAQALLEARGKDRVSSAGVGPNEHDDISIGQ